MATLSAEQLLAPASLGEAEVTVGTLGEVRVRALTRAEVLSIRKATDREDNIDGVRVLALERKMLATALVAPVLSEDQVGELQRSLPAGWLEPVVQAIQELSGMLEDSHKRAYKSVRR